MKANLAEMGAAIPVFAMVAGKPLTEIPADLFIPPDALEVLLDSFSGPLDLLLYLIKRQNIDILNIPIAHITQQYMQYIEIMEQHRLELAADYLVMAALLAEIKSRLLLPTTMTEQEQVEDDPRMVLVRKLQIYEQFKQAAIGLDNLPRCERDHFRITVSAELSTQHAKTQPEVDLMCLARVMSDLLKQQEQVSPYQIAREPLSVNERMTMVLTRLHQEKMISFYSLYNPEEGRMGLVVSLLAILELARQSLLLITQTHKYASIHLQAITHG